jgi:hypothetical protein
VWGRGYVMRDPNDPKEAGKQDLALVAA